VSKCRRILHIYLRTRDPELHSHLDALKIEPQVFLLRWVRLLLGREFHLEDILILWDAIFSHNPDLSLVDYMCVAMLMYIRSQLLERDYSGCLMRLFKYPPVEDITLFVEQALMLSQNKPIPIHAPVAAAPAPAPVVEVTTPPQAATRTLSVSDFETKPQRTIRSNSHSHSQSHSHAHPHAHGHAQQATKQLTSINPNFKHNLNMDIHTTNVAELQLQLKTLRDTQLTVAQNLEGIVQSIQKTIIENSSLTNIDPLVLALAELKQSKDILSGFLPISPPIVPENNHDHAEEQDEDEDEVDPLGVVIKQPKEKPTQVVQPPIINGPLEVKKPKKKGEKKRVTFADDVILN